MTKIKPPTPEEFEAITKLADELEGAKIAESIATVGRIAIEMKLAALIPGKAEGQRTINLADKRKVVIERGLIYTASAKSVEAIEAIFAYSEKFSPIEVKSSCKLDVTGYKWYRENDAAVFEQIAKHVEVKPKKTAVSVKPPKK